MKPLTRTPAAALLTALPAMVLAACAGSSSSPATSTEPPPATSPDGVPALTAGPPSRYRSITVVAGARRAGVPASLADGVAPMLISRDFGQPTSLVEYGLDHPVAALIFDTGAGQLTVSIGKPNFDRTGYYALRDGRANVYLVLAGGVRPVLALVGVAG